jgi:exosortase/archaeosortase family protein
VRGHTFKVVVRLFLTFAVPVAVFLVLLDPWREAEASTISTVMQGFGVSGVNDAYGYRILVLPTSATPFLAVISPSCSALAAILAFASIALFLVRGEPGRRLAAFLAAATLVLCCNFLRIGLSIWVGVKTDSEGLTVFHDWVGTAFGLIYVLGGFTVFLWMLLPSNRRLLAEYRRAQEVQRGLVSSSVGDE